MRAGLLITGTVCLAAAALAQGAAGGKVFVSDDGVEVAVVTLPGTNAALVRVTGSGTELDGKVRRHEVSDRGRSIDYQGKLRGADYNTLIARNGQYLLFVPQRGEIKVRYHEEKSKALVADAVIKEHERQTKDGSLAALERFDRAARIAEQEKGLREEVAAADKACDTRLKVTVDWAGIDDDALLHQSVVSRCAAPVGELRRLCGSATGKAWVRDQVKQVACRVAAPMSLAVAGGTLTFTMTFESTNLEEFARGKLLGEPAAAGEPPWGKQASLAQKLALEQTSLCTDGKGHYVVAAPHPQQSTQLYWGDGKSFVAVPSPGSGLSGDSFFEPRFPNPSANPSFRGYDMRLYSSVDVDREKGACAVRCGERRTSLTFVPDREAAALLLAAKVGPSPQRFRPHVLLRDERGDYYYVDKGFRSGEDRNFRLFKGPKGALRQLKMTNVVADSEGEIFSTKTGSLRLILDRKQPSLWLEGKRTTKLREVPVAENVPLIYNELGVYLGERMGTPCDDL